MLTLVMVAGSWFNHSARVKILAHWSGAVNARVSCTESRRAQGRAITRDNSIAEHPKAWHFFFVFVIQPGTVTNR